MHGVGFLGDLILIFGVSLLVVLVLNRLRLPTITGFLISGMILGPQGLSLVSDTQRIELLADVGVILLLFTVGIEFSLARLRLLWGTVLAGGLLPVLACAALGWGAASWLGLSRGEGIFLGFLVSLSSTVIPLKALAERGQIDAPHGRAATGIAVFQDLLVIPMMLLAPHLASGAAIPGGVTSATQLLSPLLALAKAAAVVAGVLLVALWAVPRLLARLAALKSREVFVISIFFICLGTAWITGQLGLSLAFGAFLAGLVISESEFGHQALADMVPFRDSFNSLFFVSAGMLMAPSAIAEMPGTVIGAALGIMVLKLAMIAGVMLLTGKRPTVALQVGLALSQVGEFAFVLMRFGSGLGLMAGAPGQVFLTSAVITMVVTPVLLAASGWVVSVVQRWEESRWWRPAKDLRDAEGPAASMRGHVVIVGYGFNGRNLARVLKEIEIPHVVLEINSETVRRARAEGETIMYGDASSRDVLEKLGAAHARVLVLAISDPVSTRRAVAVARRQFPSLHIVVRTRYLTEVDELYTLGAQCVIPEEVETSMEIFARVLAQYGFPREALVKHARRIRAERYGLFLAGRRGAEAAASQDPALSSLKRPAGRSEVQVCQIPSGSPAAGQTLRSLDLQSQTGATLLAVMRDGTISVGPSPETRIQEGDSLVFGGSPEQIGSVLDRLNPPGQPG